MTTVVLLEVPPAFEALAFAWPDHVRHCHATLVARGGAVREVHAAGCHTALRAYLDRLRGLPVAEDGAFVVHLAEADGSAVAVADRLLPRPEAWKFAEVDAPAGTRCKAGLAWSPGGRAAVGVDPGCPFARTIERTARIGWVVSGDFDPSVAFHASVAFAAVSLEAGRTVLLPETTPIRRSGRDPRWPAEATEEGLARTTCHVVVDVSADGLAAVREISECHVAFHAAVREAVSTWTYWPAVADGAPTPSTVDVPVRFASR